MPHKIGPITFLDDPEIRLEVETSNNPVEVCLTAEEAGPIGARLIGKARVAESSAGTDAPRSARDILGTGTLFQPVGFQYVLGKGKEGRIELSFSVTSNLTICFAFSDEDAKDIADAINTALSDPYWRGYTGHKH